MMRQIRFATVIVVVFITGIMSYLALNTKKPIEIETGTLYPQDFKQIGPFELISKENTPYNQDSFKNKWTLLFFGFTHCPDVCPASLVTLQQIESKIRDAIPAEKIDYVFISVDPDRDTPDKLDAYVSYFNPQFKGVTGEKSEIDKLTAYLSAFYRIPEKTSDTKDSDNSNATNYLVEHSASIYLIGANARPKALFSYPHSAEKIAADLIRLYQS